MEMEIQQLRLKPGTEWNRMKTKEKEGYFLPSVDQMLTKC